MHPLPLRRQTTGSRRANMTTYIPKNHPQPPYACTPHSSPPLSPRDVTRPCTWADFSLSLTHQLLGDEEKARGSHNHSGRDVSKTYGEEQAAKWDGDGEASERGETWSDNEETKEEEGGGGKKEKEAKVMIFDPSGLWGSQRTLPTGLPRRLSNQRYLFGLSRASQDSPVSTPTALPRPQPPSPPTTTTTTTETSTTAANSACPSTSSPGKPQPEYTYGRSCGEEYLLHPA
ncbi:hypothetical protein MKZ38_006288 [Zalerion maritima]|uniref:Uncharacterized protein n=1 Tax=Zalerion maritima TaxID=339359 RepID=A0AAD5RK60_9PEZI|nr:hypothetical protein MKZ38_006288 [Zalerion maritima]